MSKNTVTNTAIAPLASDTELAFKLETFALVSQYAAMSRSTTPISPINWIEMTDAEQSELEERLISYSLDFALKYWPVKDPDIAAHLGRNSVRAKAVQKIRDLVILRRGLSFDQGDDTERVRTEAQHAVRILQKIKVLVNGIPQNVKDRLIRQRNIVDGGTFLSVDNYILMEEAIRYFDGQSRSPRGRPSNLILSALIEHCVDTITYITGANFVINLDTHFEHGVSVFLHPHPRLCEELLKQFDPQIANADVKNALKLHFQKKIRKRSPRLSPISR